MELKEFWAAKRQLERDLAWSIQKALEDFENATGLTPDDVSVHLQTVTVLGQPQELGHRRLVHEVRVSVPLV